MATAPPCPPLEQLLDEVPVGLLVTDAVGTITSVNGTLCNWSGYNAQELVGQKKLQDLFTVGGRIFHQTHWMPILQVQGSISEVKFDLRRSDGRVLTVMLNAVRRGAGAGCHDVVSVVVAEERNKYERQLLLERKRSEELSQKQLREAEDRALFAEQMVGIVSHDLRNPLAAITMGATTIGRDATLGERHAKVLDNIHRSARRARRLIDELLDFTMIRVGHGLTVAHKPANFHELVGQLVEELKLAFPSNPIRHSAEGPGGCAVDADRIAQLLGNLVANAVTYGEPGGPITVTSWGDGGECVLTVHNLGEPIPEPMLARVFEPLVRGGTPDHSTRSVGLGLFIVKAIAQAHGGSVTVTSSREQGTTFKFVFAC
ncbi:MULTISPECIES: PAS domain-containing sensor histidine kinase [unclassified Roseateles]|uniref:PAS domain-containing sensor histidine kinase n=1 Tax=unclassified Roseateles TaxID=2626991 RepID=UPI0006F3FB83|nr:MULTISPECIES: PAS domain-containing sensor histidine kinase [unclassified Roseateles]KQW46677.1 PAS domain-containing sensor histidine kinase [Pelomonas sp. Root405]KRA73729.1 PAS domain-containing sensor histidine kinase [Pelomonas sp. Root662]